MKAYTFLTIKVPAEHQATANQLAAQIDYDTGGADTFTGDGYNATGSMSDPVEFYIREIAVRPAVADQVDGMDLPAGVEVYRDTPIDEVLDGQQPRISEE